MHYVSAYRSSPSYQARFRRMPVLMVLIPLAIFFAALADNPTPQQRKELWQVIPIVAVALTGLAVLMRAGFRRQSAVSVEIDATGIHHLAPGKTRSLLWRDLTAAKVVRAGKGEQAVRLRAPGGDYYLAQHLVPDAPDAPQLVARYRRPPLWVYPDGRREPLEIEQTYGYRLVAQYRPDLLLRSVEPGG